MRQMTLDLVRQICYTESGCTGKECYGFKVTWAADDGTECFFTYHDISFSKAEVEDFIKMLERNDVSPVHIDEIIDDYFYSA